MSLTRESLERMEMENLAPYAVKSAESGGRKYPESKHPYRTEFQRDRDRIVHSTAFRRLQYKTQVFVNHEGDHYRTRLTHTMEVAIISRSIARALRLNEDLTEAIALAHDLGHTPFGHSGEDALNELMKDHGGFEHNRQCIRVVDLIENRYPDFPGLNLTFEIREGILKHNTLYDRPDVPQELRLGPSAPLECQVVNVADEIAYNSHDIDDGLSSGILSEEQLKTLSLWKKGIERMEIGYPESGARLRRHYMIRFLINYLVTDLVRTSSEIIGSTSPKGADDVRAHKEIMVKFSDEIQEENRKLKQFLRMNLYRYPKLVRMTDNARRIVEGLYRYYKENPGKLPPHTLSRLERDSEELVIADYIAGMTDRFACSEYDRLIEPLENMRELAI